MRKSDHGLRLSTIVTIGGMTLAALTVLCAIATASLTTLMREGTETVQSANHAIRAAVDIHTNLVGVGRESALAAWTADPAHDAARRASEANLVAALAEARRQIGAGGDVGLIDDVDRKVRVYLDALRASEARRESVRDAMLAVEAPRQAALAASDAFVDATTQRAATVETRVRLWDVLGTVIGTAVGLITLVGVAAVLVATHRLFSRPVIGLSRAIRAFARGDRSSRAHPAGAAELVEVGRAFNELADELATEEQRRLAFVGGVAHDLRNPLTALRMALHFVQPGRPLPPEPKLRDTFGLVTRQITRLDRMLGDFLDAVRIQRGELDLRIETRDARELTRNAVELYANASRIHTLALSTPECPVEIAADATRIEQVLNNLISNAIKYSPHGGTVAITVRAEGDEAVMAVTDEGIGLAARDQEAIFDAFRRTGASREVAGGAGLGLSVARRIVEAHDGRIEVNSMVGVGSTFTIRLPLLKPVDAQRLDRQTVPVSIGPEAPRLV
jgi:signal transduction histidine kinase